MTDEREAAWWALHDALPPGWRIGELTFDPAIGQTSSPPCHRGRTGVGSRRNASWSDAASTNWRQFGH
jgi:hypothetical protein